ncbi:MAG: TetR-like C-terminal domain-containing protein, partial [Actinomycetes bacterium]
MARKAGVTVDHVLDAAARIADRDGLQAVSLAAVAAVVGIRTPSLYAHVVGLAGLRRDLARRAARQLSDRLQSAAEHEADPVAALRAVAYEYRTFAREHPGLYASLLPAPRADRDPDGAAAAAEPVRVVARA